MRDDNLEMIHTRNTVRDDNLDLIHTRNTLRDENTDMIYTRNTVRDDNLEMIHTRNTVTDEATNMELDRNTMIDASNNNADANARIVDHTARIKQRQQGSYIGLVHQAKCKVTRSHVDLRADSIGDNVAVPVPTVITREEETLVTGVIMDVTDKDQYRIAVKYGVLKGHCSRNQFDLCPQQLLTMNDVNTESMISLNEAVVRQSALGGQGFVKCSCNGTKKCTTNICKCLKSKLQCNSSCHNCLNCTNK